MLLTRYLIFLVVAHTDGLLSKIVTLIFILTEMLFLFALLQYKKNKRSLRKLSSHRRPLERKDFNQLEDDTNILNRKRSNLAANNVSKDFTLV